MTDRKTYSQKYKDDAVELMISSGRQRPNARAGHRPPAAALTAHQTRDQESLAT